MATKWVGKCWMGSASGYVDIEVSAATYQGAKEQLERVYGATQIINLRQVSNNTSSSFSNSSSGSDGIGVLALAVLIGGAYLLINFWPIFVGLVVLSLIYYIFK